jgi:putative hemolysin
VRARDQGQSPHSLLPVADGSPDNIVGVVKVRDVLAVLLAGKRCKIARLMKKAEIIPDQLDAMDALRILQQSDVSMALVHDEYGHLEGRGHAGRSAGRDRRHFRQPSGRGRRADDRRARGWIAAGGGACRRTSWPSGWGSNCRTTANMRPRRAMSCRCSSTCRTKGEHFAEQDWRFEVVDMDGRKIDKLLVSRVDQTGG